VAERDAAQLGVILGCATLVMLMRLG